MTTEMDKHGIIAGGNFIRDYIRVIDQYPSEETLSNIISTDSNNGGAAYNVLKDLSKMKSGFPLYGIGMIGEDETGREIVQDCKAHGINMKGVLTTSGAGTSFTNVMISRESGKRTFFHYRGANALLAPEHFEFSLFPAKLFHLGYPLLLDSLDSFYGDNKTGASLVLEKAKEHGLIVSVDLVSVNNDRFREIVSPVFPFTDYLFMNEIEAEKLTGIRIINGNNPDLKKITEAANLLLNKGVKNIIIHCAGGAVACSREGIEIQGSVLFPADKIEGTTGAGDALAAGFLYGLHEDLPVQECLRFGVCTACSCLTHATCSSGIGPAGKCLELGERYGFRDLR